MNPVGMKYGSFDLQSGGITVTSTDIYNPPANSIQADELAESDGAIIVKQRYTSKTFVVEGYLQAADRPTLDTLRDTFLAALSVKNQSFDITYGLGLRRYLASPQNIITAYAGATTYRFNVEFLSPDGMGWDLTSSSLVSALNVTSATADQPITVEGSYQGEPLITVNIGTVTGATTKTITISNGVSLRGLSITRTWTAGDVLEIDTLKKTVYVNDIATEFRGQFPVWQPGPGVLSYLDDFTTRNITINASYTRRWL